MLPRVRLSNECVSNNIKLSNRMNLVLESGGIENRKGVQYSGYKTLCEN